MADRIEVRKTYKLYIGGAFPRTESGRSYLVTAADGTPLANACRASRKDLRDAVRAARKAFPGWAGKTAMNRGQVLYRVAELMEGRRDQFVAEVAAAEGLRDAAGPRGRRPGHRPLGLVRRLGRQDRPGPRLVQPGRRAVLQLHDPRADRRRRRRRARDLVAARARQPARPAAGRRATPSSCSRRETRPLPAVTLTEVLATSDVPGGVVNVLTGLKTELVPVLAGARRRRRARHLGRPRRHARPRPSSSPPTTSSASCAGRPRSPRPASTGSTTAPPNAPNGSPPSSR